MSTTLSLFLRRNLNKIVDSTIFLFVVAELAELTPDHHFASVSIPAFSLRMFGKISGDGIKIDAQLL
jgi:hypothetical protein